MLRLLRIFYNLPCNFTRLPILQHHCVQPWLLFRIKRKTFPQGWMNNTTLSIQRHISWHLHEDACDIPLSTRRYFSRIDDRLAPYISVQRSEYLCAAWEANREDRVGGHVFIENIRADDFAMAITAFQNRTFRRKRFRTRARKSFQWLFQSSSRNVV